MGPGWRPALDMTAPRHDLCGALVACVKFTWWVDVFMEVMNAVE